MPKKEELRKLKADDRLVFEHGGGLSDKPHLFVSIKGSKHNILNLISMHVGNIDPSTEVNVVGSLQMVRPLEVSELLSKLQKLKEDISAHGVSQPGSGIVGTIVPTPTMNELLQFLEKLK